MVHATWKLPYHFQKYIVIVITQPPLRATLRGTDYVERVAKWGTVLGASNVKYMPRTYVKGLVLASLVAWLDESPLRKEPPGGSQLSGRLAPCARPSSPLGARRPANLVAGPLWAPMEEGDDRANHFQEAPW